MTYALSLLVRWGRVIHHGFSHRAIVTVLNPDMVRLNIPTTSKWKPGQHYFFRFLTGDMHALTSHPFTIASIPTQDGKSQMEVYVKLRRGMTAGLMKHADGPGIRTLIDGPYGGLGGDLGLYDKVLLLGGGSGEFHDLELEADAVGGSFILGVLRHLVQDQTKECKSITVVYSCRTMGE